MFYLRWPAILLHASQHLKDTASTSSRIATMCVVAVPGGTGSIGKTIVEQLQITDQHEVLILTRKVAQLS